MADRPLPPTIRPRVLARAATFDGFVTTDGRYELRPDRYGTDRRVRMWTGTDTTGRHFPGTNSTTQLFTSRDDFRTQHCARDGKVPWLVCDMDDGVLRVEPTRSAAARWGATFTDSQTYRFTLGSTCYEYEYDDCTTLFIVRADNAHLHGFDPEQQPLYPFPDDPYEEVTRPGAEDR